jgi:hypothetical protein
LEEQVRGFGIEGDVTDFVDHDQSDPADLLELGIKAAEAVRLGQAGDPRCCGGEPDPISGVRGRHRKRRGQMRFPGPRRPQQNDVAGFSDPPPASRRAICPRSTAG